MKRTRTIARACVAALSMMAPAAAAFGQVPAAPAAPVHGVSLPNLGAVASVYSQFNLGPIWFRGGVPSPAVNQLTAILRRAPVDGLASGPQLAAEVEAAVRQAATGNPAAVAAAERTLSAAWVLYVQTIRRPTPGMIYAYDVLRPQSTRADQILRIAAAAPTLHQHLVQVAAVNPVYAGIRDAEWARMQASGSASPDPRVLANLERARSIPAGGRFILVDSATQMMWLYENGRPIDSMKVIVGTDEFATPLIASYMYYVSFNPYWNAPDHLVRKAIAPNVLSQGMKYLKTRGYEVMADWTEDAAVIPPEQVDWKAVAAGKKKIRIRQKAGPDNFMGDLKFPFANPEDIYLHDTPRKDLFAEANRALSNGCVRVEDAKRLGRWLLGYEPVPPSPEPEFRVKIPRPMPIYLTYLTAQPSNGQLTFFNDVYGWDKPGAQVASSYASPVAGGR